MTAVAEHPAGGPLTGTRVLELSAIGPAPFAAMMLGDLGAEVTRVDRVDDVDEPTADPLSRVFAGVDHLGRNRRRIALDLRQPAGVETFLALATGADVLLEGFRPGVAERLGIGPDACRLRNPGLVYGRATGWGRDGPLAAAAGHDLNFLALTGALDAIGHDGGPPAAPLGFIGDFGGGGLLLAFGVVAALLERRGSGQGQVVDAAVVDGVGLLGIVAGYLAAHGAAGGPRGTNALDGGHPTYGVYRAADGVWLSVGAIEPRFRRTLLAGLGLAETGDEPPSTWPALRAKITGVLETQDSDFWVRRFEDQDVCLTPVLSFEQSRRHPQQLWRKAFVEVAGELQPAPGPRFSRTAPSAPLPAPGVGADTIEVLQDVGFSPAAIHDLLDRGVVRRPVATPAS